jgi:hypothetical protein
MAEPERGRSKLAVPINMGDAQKLLADQIKPRGVQTATIALSQSPTLTPADNLTDR